MIRKIIGYGLLLAMIGTGIYVRFSHPELTETQLFIEFWYVWMLMIATVFVALWVLSGAKK